MARSSDPTKPARLTIRQQLFIEEFLLDFNAKRAAEAAGYSKKDSGRGSVLLHTPAIALEIQRRCITLQSRFEITGDDIRYGLARIAYCPLPEDEGGPSWETRVAAFDKLAKLFGLYIEKHVFTGATLEQLLAMANDRAKTLPAPEPPLRLITGGKSE